MALLVGERDGRDLGGTEQHAQGRADHGERDDGPPRHRRPRTRTYRRECAGGSVERCAVNTSVPPTQATIATAMPGDRVPRGGEHGDQDRPEDEHGLVEHRLQRERGLQLGGPVEHVGPAGPHARADLGRNAPATAAKTYDVTIGQSACTDQTSIAVPTPKPTLATASTRAWPSRSSSRPCRIAKPALAIMYAADTAPATPYEPVAAETSSTMPRPTIEIGSLATRPIIEKRRVPGWRGSGGTT